MFTHPFRGPQSVGLGMGVADVPKDHRFLLRVEDTSEALGAAECLHCHRRPASFRKGFVGRNHGGRAQAGLLTGRRQGVPRQAQLDSALAAGIEFIQGPGGGPHSQFTKSLTEKISLNLI